MRPYQIRHLGISSYTKCHKFAFLHPSKGAGACKEVHINRVAKMNFSDESDSERAVIRPY